jgi:hypothetical protein
MKLLRSLLLALQNREGEDVRLLINDFIVPERAEGEIIMAEVHQQRQLDL